MKQFPDAVSRSMRANGSSATCVSIQLDDGEWEAAFFFDLGGDDHRVERRTLAKRGGKPVALGLETDMVETDAGAVVVVRLEAHITEQALPFEVLFTPGGVEEQYQSLKHLSGQPRLCWFFGDEKHRLLHAQCHPLEAEHHREFASLASDALKHDALLRMMRQYDADAARRTVTARFVTQRN